MAREIRIGGIRATFTMRNDDFLQKTKTSVDAVRRNDRALRDLGRTSQRVRGQIRQLVGGLGLLTGGLLGVGAIRGIFGSSNREVADYGATLFEAARIAGLTVEQHLILRRAFEGEGVAIKNTDKALQNLLKNLGSAPVTPNTDRLFRQLNIDAEEFLSSGQTTLDLIDQLGAGLRNLQSQGERVYIARTLLGREGAPLLPVLQQSTEEWERLSESIRANSLITTRQAATLKTLAQIYTDNANRVADSSRRLAAEGAVASAAWDTFLSGVQISALTAIRRSMIAIAENTREARLALSVLLTLLLGSRLAAFAVSLYHLARALVAVATSAVAAGTAMAALRIALLRLAIIGAVIVALDAVLKRLGVFSGEMSDVETRVHDDTQALLDAQQNMIDQIAKTGAALEQDVVTIPVQIDLQVAGREGAAQLTAQRQIAKFVRDLDQERALTGLSGTARDEEERRLANRAKVYDDLEAKIYAAVAAEQRLVDLRKVQAELEGRGSEAEFLALARNIARAEKSVALTERNIELAREQYGQALRNADLLTDLQNRQARAAAANAKFQAEQKEQSAQLGSAYQQVGQAVGQFAAQAVLDFGNVRDAVKNLLQAILDVVAQLLIVQPIAQAIVTGLGGTFGVPAKAAGGPVAGRLPVLVGERGPELFVPGTSGRIIPNSDLRQGGTGGLTVNFAPVVQVADRRAVDLALAEAYPAFESRIKGAVALDLVRPSPLRRAARA